MAPSCKIILQFFSKYQLTTSNPFFAGDTSETDMNSKLEKFCIKLKSVSEKKKNDNKKADSSFLIIYVKYIDLLNYLYFILYIFR